MFRKQPVHLYTVPKGTLLFRTAERYDTDFTGVPLNGESCIPPQYNVFFYFNPFAVESVHWYDFIKDMRVYETTQDTKVVLLLKPSKMTRGDSRNKTKKSILIPCSKTRKACVKGRDYDPCFSESFLKKHPDVLGYMGMARKDAQQLRDAMKTSLKHVVKYIQLAEDERGFKGTPEVVLYPLRKRNFEDIMIKDKDGFVKNHDFNFRYIKTLSRERKELVDFMEKHTVQNPDTGFFTYKEKSK